MKNYLIGGVILLLIGSFIYWQQMRIKSLTVDRDKYRSNTETLLQDVQHYSTSDSLSAAKVGNMTLTIGEYEKYRADDLKTIEALKTKGRDLERVTTAQTETINQLRGSVRDSIVYLPGDTVVMKCVDIRDKWFDFTGCLSPAGAFTGTHVSRDSLLIAETVEYKRFWGFLWKTSKVKSREIDVVAKNPATVIMGVEFTTIEK